jgi:hypothetical protein
MGRIDDFFAAIDSLTSKLRGLDTVTTENQRTVSRSTREHEKAIEQQRRNDEQLRKTRNAAAQSGLSFFASFGPAQAIAQTKQDLQHLGSVSFGGNLQSLAGGVSGGLGAFVGDVRETLGGVSARSNTASRLGDLAELFAKSGAPLGRGELEQLRGVIQAQEGDAAKARNLANDVAGDANNKDLGDLIYEAVQEGKKAFEELRRWFGSSDPPQRSKGGR